MDEVGHLTGSALYESGACHFVVVAQLACSCTTLSGSSASIRQPVSKLSDSIDNPRRRVAASRYPDRRSNSTGHRPVGHQKLITCVSRYMYYRTSKLELQVICRKYFIHLSANSCTTCATSLAPSDT